MKLGNISFGDYVTMQVQKSKIIFGENIHTGCMTKELDKIKFDKLVEATGRYLHLCKLNGAIN